MVKTNMADHIDDLSMPHNINSYCDSMLTNETLVTPYTPAPSVEGHFSERCHSFEG